MLAYIVLTILGVPYAGSLAVIIFLLDLVPLVGATLGAILVGLITLFNDFPTDTVVWVIWSIVYQQVENNVIQPRIQARALQVHPFVVLTSVLFGSTLFGVLGALLAIPVAAAIQIAIIEYNTLRNAPAIGAIQAPPAGRRGRARPGLAVAERRDAGLGVGDRGVEHGVDLLLAERAATLLHARGCGVLGDRQGGDQRRRRRAAPAARSPSSRSSASAMTRSIEPNTRSRPAATAGTSAASRRWSSSSGSIQPLSPRSQRAHDRDRGRRLAQRRLERLDRLRRLAEDDVLLRREVAEDGRARDVGRLGDLVDRRAAEAVLGEQAHRAVMDRVARRLLLALPQTAHPGDTLTQSKSRLS